MTLLVAVRDSVFEFVSVLLEEYDLEVVREVVTSEVTLEVAEFDAVCVHVEEYDLEVVRDGVTSEVPLAVSDFDFVCVRVEDKAAAPAFSEARKRTDKRRAEIIASLVSFAIRIKTRKATLPFVHC